MTDAVLDALEAPVDPRLSWELPAFGTLTPIVELDAVTTRILAPNPSPMTLDGTNTYVVGNPGSGACAIIDPGPLDARHAEAARSVLTERDATCELILITHHHGDHAEAAASWADAFGCRIAAPTPETAGPRGVLLHDNDELDIGGLVIRAVGTPGHTRDHTSFRLPTGALLTGDHILGRGTSVVAHPDGDLDDYLASLRRVLHLGPHTLFPGHGPELRRDPTAVVAYYLEHRGYRERQITAVLAEAMQTTTQLVARIYAAHPQAVWPAAELSTLATLAKLQAAGTVVRRGDGWATAS